MVLLSGMYIIFIIIWSYRENVVGMKRTQLINDLYDTIDFLIENDWEYYKNNFNNRYTFQDYYWTYGKMINHFLENDFSKMVTDKYELILRMKERVELLVKKKENEV